MINLVILENNIVKQIAVCHDIDDDLAIAIADGKTYKWVPNDELIQIDWIWQNNKFIAPPIVEDVEANAELEKQIAEAQARLEAKMNARAKLIALGLTPDEIAAL